VPDQLLTAGLADRYAIVRELGRGGPCRAVPSRDRDRGALTRPHIGASAGWFTMIERHWKRLSNTPSAPNSFEVRNLLWGQE
jgi:hypothetical protein